MRRTLLACFLLLTFLIPLNILASPPVIERVEKSLVRLTHPVEDDEEKSAICTAFMVRANAALTAHHCVTSDDLYADGEPTHLLKVNSELALIDVMPGKPVLDIRRTPLKVGDRVLTFGFGLGELFVFDRMVAGMKGGDIALDNPLVPGMSGGPVVDSEGKVVGINQSLISGVIGIACGQEEIRDFLK